MSKKDEQAERIMENYSSMVSESKESGLPINPFEWESVFEDRDPAEFF